MWVTDGTTLVDRYLLEDRLGRGGMGCVWRARDLLLGRQVAIKLTDHAGAARGPAERRLRREAMVISSLTERRLARVYDYFETDQGSFIVMELVHGESLSARIKREGPLPAAEAISIVAECAEALHAAHRAGVVHRDVKPSNIMLTGSEVKIVDFGIAARTHPAPGSGEAQDPAELETETMTGNLVGTIAYLAPERISGAPDTPAADLYSLGVVFYQLLSGRLPFEATEPIAVLCAHAEGRAKPLPPEVPPAVAEFCYQLMARDPADRPPTAAIAAARLRALDLEQTQPTPQPGPAEDAAPVAAFSFLRPLASAARRPARAGRQFKAALAAGSVATMAMAGGTAWLVTGLGAQAAASPNAATSAPASGSAASGSASSTPVPAHPVAAVITPSHAANTVPTHSAQVPASAKAPITVKEPATGKGSGGKPPAGGPAHKSDDGSGKHGKGH